MAGKSRNGWSNLLDGDGTGSTIISGSTTNTLAFRSTSRSLNDQQVRVVVTNNLGCVSISNAATIRVTGPLWIEVDPQPIVVCSGQGHLAVLRQLHLLLRPDANYRNNATGSCLINGTIKAVITPSYTPCAGRIISVKCERADVCGNALNKTITISVSPCPPTAVELIPGTTTCKQDNGALLIGAITGGTAPYSYAVDGKYYKRSGNAILLR